MSYTSIVAMANSNSLRERIVAAAADEGLDQDPVQWVHANIWKIVSAGSDWQTNWDYAAAQANVNANPDTGARNDVITDAMILAVVQPMVVPVP